MKTTIIEWHCPNCTSTINTSTEQSEEFSISCPSCGKGARIFIGEQSGSFIQAKKAVFDPTYQRPTKEPITLSGHALHYGAKQGGGYRAIVSGCRHCGGGEHQQDLGLTYGKQPALGSQWGPFICSTFQARSELSQERHRYIVEITEVTNAENLRTSNKYW